MGYDRGDSFPFNFEPNGNPFGSKSKGKLSPRSVDHIPFNVKGKGNKVSSVCIYMCIYMCIYIHSSTILVETDEEMSQFP